MTYAQAIGCAAFGYDQNQHLHRRQSDVRVLRLLLCVLSHQQPAELRLKEREQAETTEQQQQYGEDYAGAAAAAATGSKKKKGKKQRVQSKGRR